MFSNNALEARRSVTAPTFPDRCLWTTDLNANDAKDLIDHFVPTSSVPRIGVEMAAVAFIYGLCELLVSDKSELKGRAFVVSPLAAIVMIVAGVAWAILRNNRIIYKERCDFNGSLKNELWVKGPVSAVFCSFLLRSKCTSKHYCYLRILSFKQIQEGLDIAERFEPRATIILRQFTQFDPYISHIFSKILHPNFAGYERLVAPEHKSLLKNTPYLLEAGASCLGSELSGFRQLALESLVEELVPESEKAMNSQMVTIYFARDKSLRVSREFASELSEVFKKQIINHDDIFLETIFVEDFHQLTVVMEMGSTALTLANVLPVAKIANKLGLKNVLQACLKYLIDNNAWSKVDLQLFKPLEDRAEIIAGYVIDCRFTIRPGTYWMESMVKERQAEFKELEVIFNNIGLPAVPFIIKSKAQSDFLKRICGIAS